MFVEARARMPDKTPAPSTLFRIVKSDPPTERDFMSNRALGLDPPDETRATFRVHQGVSLWRKLAQARRKARTYPGLGGFIAEVRIDPERVTIEKTFGRGHFTGWGDPADLLGSVVGTERVDK
jgi:hypothetical protein